MYVNYLTKLTTAEGICGDGWDLYHDDYYDICYKYIAEGLGDYQTVATACRGEMDSTLPTINSFEEQEFLDKLIIKYKMVDNVWLDAGIKNKHIVWTDSSSGEYENWIPGRPVDDGNCVEMLADKANVGKWADEPCTKKNAYMCKRLVMWSGQRMERLIRDNRRLLNELKQFQNKLQSEITQIKDTQIPIGFTYVQLPGKPEPKTLWPAYTWSDVTAEYAGQFFRAEGNGSLEFGKGIQAENAPRLSKVQKFYKTSEIYEDADLTPGVWSKNVLSGGPGSGIDHNSLKYLLSAGEVRPRNQAVRIFQRTK
ncbi:unnamed protein product [Medioppia subpectinata]|uniref:C-type lectin domain-containing protein n=1 Tax=Medioppia subpectinata TaxID=1979941 RepID=A0A7R9KYP6_9ACAR|nr:unnamed protein product [Medioppia subpectinata]CAG2111045.1 unnamed protein product [Medioppia subpectinata]